MKNICKSLTMLTMLLPGCGGQNINDYAGKAPAITLRDFYNAPVEGYGFFQDRSGQVVSRYYAILIPAWNGNEGTMIEKQWNDKGELFLEQNWRMHMNDNGHDFTATATRIDGTVKGESSGFALHMQYTLIGRTDSGKDINLTADDWTYLQPDGSGINKVALSKFGFHVGDVTYDLRKVPKGQQLREGYFPK